MITVIDAGSSKTHFIQEICSNFHPTRTIGWYDVTESDVTESDGIIISGAPILLTEVDANQYIVKLNWIEQYNKPVLGICFGHQVIGLYFGASISKQRDDRSLQTIEVIQGNTLFEDLDTEFTMQEDHCEAISIAPDFELSATSDSCVNEAMHHKKRPIFGIQFHPEVSGENGEILLRNFTKLVEIYQKK